MIVFVAIALVCMTIDYCLTNTITWSSFVALALICISLSISIGIERRKSLSAILLAEYVFITGISIYWNLITPSKFMWSTNYVLPLFSVVMLIVNFVLRCVFKKSFFKFYRNILITSGVCITCIILYHQSILNVGWASYLSGIVGIIALFGNTIFDYKRLKEELKMRMHF